MLGYDVRRWCWDVAYARRWWEKKCQLCQVGMLRCESTLKPRLGRLEFSRSRVLTSR